MKDDVREVRVKVTADAHREHVSVEDDGRLHIFVKEPPAGNMANMRVRKVIADHFRVPYTQVRLVRGAKSRAKVFSIRSS
jgi:uncharacterized protein YggU (UPF0235/DUF167 family)